MCFLSLGQSSLPLTLTFLCLAWSAGLPRAPEAAPGDRQSLPLRAHGPGQACCQRLPDSESQVGPHLTASRRSSRAELRRRRLERAAGWGQEGRRGARRLRLMRFTSKGSVQPFSPRQRWVRFHSPHSCKREAERTKQRSGGALTKGVILTPLKFSLPFAWKQKAVLLLIKS